MFMKKRTAAVSIIVIALVAAIIYAISVMLAQAKDSIEITGAWVPLAPPKAKIMAGYLMIKNPTDKMIEITSVSSPDFANVMIHETIVKDGVSRMEMRDKLLLDPGEEVVLQRGGLHLMLMYKKKVFKEGDTVILNFATSKGTISITAPVKVAAVDGE
jgi:copper(I)-binding protein